MQKAVCMPLYEYDWTNIKMKVGLCSFVVLIIVCVFILQLVNVDLLVFVWYLLNHILIIAHACIDTDHIYRHVYYFKLTH